MTAPRKRGRHAASRRRPIRLAVTWTRVRLHQLLSWLQGWRNVQGLTPRDEGTVAWAQFLRQQQPVRWTALQLRVRIAALEGVRRAALDKLSPPPDPLRFGDLAVKQYGDDTGTWSRDLLAKPALHADESFSMTRDDMAARLAEHAKDWTP